MSSWLFQYFFWCSSDSGCHFCSTSKSWHKSGAKNGNSGCNSSAYYCSVQPCFTIQISSSDTPSEDLSTEYLWKTHYNHRLIAVSLFCCCCCRPVLCMHLFRCYTDINLLTLRAAKSVQIQAICSFSSVSSLFYLLLSLLCPSGCFKFLMSPNEVLNQ